MKKILGLLTLIALPCFAQVDPSAQAQLEAIRNGQDSADGIQRLFVKTTSTTLGNTTVGGSLTVSGAVNQTVGSSVGVINTNAVPQINLVSTINVTNTQVIVPAVPIYRMLNSTVASNNFTLGNPVNGAGQKVQFVNASSSTNSFWIGDTTNINMVANMLLGTDDSITFVSMSSTQWVEEARSNN